MGNRRAGWHPAGAHGRARHAWPVRRRIGLVLGYASIAQLGILNGVNRELPYHMGRGDIARAHALAAAGQAWALATGGVISLCLLAVAAWQLVQGDLQQAAGWATNAILAMFAFYGNGGYLSITFRTSSELVRR